jgi:hypothetical protein
VLCSFLHRQCRSRDSSGLQRWATDWMNGGSTSGSAGNLSLHRSVQNDSEAHPASYPVGTWGFFPGVKATGA